MQKHNAIQGIEPQFEKLDLDEDRSDAGTEITVNTIDTFASNYSNCSNVSFNRYIIATLFQNISICHGVQLISSD